MSFRAVFGWDRNSYAFIKLSVRPSLICWANQRFRTSIPARHHSLLCGDAAPSTASLAPPYSQRLQINTPPLPPQCRPSSHQLEWAAIGGPGLLDHQVESLFGHQVLEFGQVLGDDRVPPQGGSQL